MTRASLSPEIAQALSYETDYPEGDDTWVLANEIIDGDSMSMAQWVAEENAYHDLPHFVVVDVAEALEKFRTEATLVQAFQFNVTDLLDDLVQANTDVNRADKEIEEYTTNLYHDIEAEGWADEGRALLDAVYGMGQHLREVIEQHRLYTPSGCSMYAMHKWLDNDSIILEKVVVRDWEVSERKGRS